MSHLTRIKTTIKNPEILEKVLKSMIESRLDGILTNSRLEENTTIIDYFGKQKTAHFVIRRSKYNDFGFVLNTNGEYEFISDNDAKGRKQFLAQLLPWYARENTIASLISQGFDIESQIEEDGTVKIVAGKWS
ncbi:MAG: hypothetical protein [Phormidium phage MIS-PhV1A]|uniref:hypothetical protein n=1 Tax=Phormidium phage MIS-PhV1A TaxID=1391455 RepID=UPI0003C98DB6|nr:MAG: hypothetical protein AV945_gp05 [Phormidium phage MIS-PhV1A]AGZ61750.1 MAG: hypothetical protein [Phormidium phage MIS-PhV1A]